MKSVEERLNGKGYNEKQTKRIYDNETSFIDKIKEQCTDKTRVERPHPLINHYILESGTHVYTLIGNNEEKIIITNNENAEEIKDSDYYQSLPANGVFIRLIKYNGRDEAERRVSYIARDKGKDVFAAQIFDGTISLYNGHRAY